MRTYSDGDIEDEREAAMFPDEADRVEYAESLETVDWGEPVPEPED